jgi:PTS system fructose-specific IIC component
VLGLAFITEGAIPFAARDLSAHDPVAHDRVGDRGRDLDGGGRGTAVPHGGIFVLPIPGAVTHLAAYALAIAAGAVVTCSSAAEAQTAASTLTACFQ